MSFPFKCWISTISLESFNISICRRKHMQIVNQKYMWESLFTWSSQHCSISTTRNMTLNCLELHELLWINVQPAVAHLFTPFLLAAAACFKQTAAAVLQQLPPCAASDINWETFWLSIVTSVKSWTLENCNRQRHSTSDRWGSKSERTGRRMLRGRGVVQGSWRPRYWTRFLLCKANRNLKDRACIPLQVLRR